MRRTQLANERTYLAWWRTGLAALAVAVGTGRVVPELTSDPAWPYTVAGAGFALLGVGLIAYAMVRHRRVEAAIVRGEVVPPDSRVVIAMTALGVLLGLLVLGLVVAD